MEGKFWFLCFFFFLGFCIWKESKLPCLAQFCTVFFLLFLNNCYLIFKIWFLLLPAFSRWLVSFLSYSLILNWTSCGFCETEITLFRFYCRINNFEFFFFFLEKIELFVIPVSDLESSFYSEWKYMSAFLNGIMEVKCLKFCDIGVNVKLGLHKTRCIEEIRSLNCTLKWVRKCIHKPQGVSSSGKVLGLGGISIRSKVQILLGAKNSWDHTRRRSWSLTQSVWSGRFAWVWGLPTGMGRIDGPPSAATHFY
jgi:hypothetical protein